MQLSLTQKIIIVTGGAKGIGLGICKVLAEENAIPFIVGRNENDNIKAVEELKAIGKEAHQVAADLTKPEDCKKAVEDVIAKFGRIDGLVNNDGVNDGVGVEHGNYEDFAASLHKN